jgi:hypothetical protein
MANANDKYRLFAEHYKQHGSSEQAALHAGYSAKHANTSGIRLLKHHKVMALLSNSSDPTLNGVIVTSIKPLITGDWISEQLQSIILDEATPPAAKVSALGQLAKMHGHDTAKNYISIKGISDKASDQSTAILNSVIIGKLDTATASSVLSVISSTVKIKESTELEQRISALEVKHGIN